MGAPMSNHDGVTCIPAMKDHSDEKYIVKVISIPASQVQLDALLLAGAYKDAASAMDYFKELSDGVIHEAECLKKLSKLEGFLPFERWQVVPMEKSKLGYQVYLVGTYKRSLEKYMRRNTMTHLSTVNLGLDMCAALTVARQAGWIYVDLKPSNIFISEDKEYRIGDLGFMALDSLKYAALPSKYCSPYIAPELTDPLATPNETIDTYAAGMILYQIFNNGVLPQVEHPTEEALPAPANADYEMAEIILKACAPDPKDRWADPVEMGQALVAYMQRNTVNDTPILPPMVPVDEELPAEPAVKKRRDETLPSVEDAKEVSTENLSEEMTSMLAQADDLISHEPPAPTVAPEPVSVEQLEAQLQEAAPQENAVAVEDPPADQTDTPAEEKAEADDFTDLDVKRRAERRKAWITPIVIVLVLALLVSGGIWFYRNYYLMTIDELKVEGTENEITVILDTDIDSSLLTAICTDTYGNTKESPVQEGKATFTELLPDMLYKIRIEVEGFHKLDGSTTHEYTTPAQTSIVSYTAVTGPEDGSVILNFTVDGPDSEEWNVVYSAEGEEEQRAAFTGHMVTVSGLTVDKVYTFRLEPVSELYIVGEDTLTFTASRIIIAQDLHVSMSGNDSLTVVWSAPADTTVESWNVHCYSSSGYDKLITTSELTAAFDEIDSGSAYTIEVTAAGMTQPARTSVTANPLNITAVNVSADQAEVLNVSWEFEGNAPVGGWLLMYTIDGSTRQEVVQCDSNSAVIEVRVPGAAYDLSIEAADGSSVFGNTYSYKCPNAAVYENTAYGIYAKHIEGYLNVNLLPTPEKANWSYKDVYNGNFTTTFTSGQGISVLIHLGVDFYVPRDNTSILYVIRDAEGKVVSELVSKETRVWYDMWWNTNYHYCELDVPAVPTAAGDYSLSIYFNGMAITTVNFTITE